MLKAFLTLLISLLPSFLLTAQNGVQMQKVYWGIGVDQFYNTKVLKSGKIVLVGRTDSHRGGGHQNKDAWVVMLSPKGDTLWSRAFGGVSKTDRFWDVEESPNGDLIFAGASGSFGGSENAYVVHTDSNGLIRDSYNYGDKGFDNVNDIELLDNGDRILLGFSQLDPKKKEGSSDLLLIRTDSCGAVVWQQQMKSKTRSFGIKLLISKSQKIHVLGRLEEQDKNAILYQQYNLNGELLLSKSYKRESAQSDYPFDLEFNFKGNLYITGFNGLEQYKALLVEIDTLGQLIQSNIYQADLALEGFDLAIDEKDSSLWMVGYYSRLENYNEACLLHLDQDLNVIKASSYWPDYKSVHFNAVELLQNDQLLLVGSHSYWYGEELGAYVVVKNKASQNDRFEREFKVKKTARKLITVDIPFEKAPIQGFQRVNSLVLPIPIDIIDFMLDTD